MGGSATAAPLDGLASPTRSGAGRRRARGAANLSARFPALAAACAALFIAACSAPRGGEPGGQGTIVAFNAGSMARPLRAALDSFAAPRDLRVEQENAGSLESARKLTDLHRIPDVIALADYEVFPQVLMPEHVRWYAKFARNRMVLAYTDQSHYASQIDSTNWWQLLDRPGVRVGRSDPNLDPNGYRTLVVLELAERRYHRPGLAARLLHDPLAVVRPKEVDLVGLLQTGELDYIWSYESVARAAGLRFVRLPEAIDLSNPADSALYATVVVRVRGRTPRDTLTLRGEPIVYGFAVPAHPPHPDLATAFAAFLVSDRGTRILREQHLDVLDAPIFVGTNVPAPVLAAAHARVRNDSTPAGP